MHGVCFVDLVPELISEAFWGYFETDSGDASHHVRIDSSTLSGRLKACGRCLHGTR